jgi:hypothetical protein
LAERRRHGLRPPSDGPSSNDIWQAATLLIGVYGQEAVAYADHRRDEQHRLGDFDAAETWSLIVSEIEQLMRTAPASHLH